MLQSGRYPRDSVDLHGGQAEPVYAAAELADATDNTADAREPIDSKLVVGAADAGLTQADAYALPKRKASAAMLQPPRSTKLDQMFA